MWNIENHYRKVSMMIRYSAEDCGGEIKVLFLGRLIFRVRQSFIDCGCGILNKKSC